MSAPSSSKFEEEACVEEGESVRLQSQASVRQFSETETEVLDNAILWSEGGDFPEFHIEPFDKSGCFLLGKSPSEKSILQPIWSEDYIDFEYGWRSSGEMEESLGEEFYEIVREPEPPGPTFQEPRRRSLFVHSSPTHFPDIKRARKSVFGSIFLRTPARVAEEAALLKSVAESNYSMVQSLLNSFDKIISAVTSEADKKQMTLAYKDSVLRALENHGITRTYSDGSIHWDIYPITQSYLFTVQVGDHTHQTRNLTKIEDRITTGPVQTLRFPYEWPTDSVWTGYWDALGMAGVGTYVMAHGVSYYGKMRDGMFHDDNATLTYPSKFKALHCVYDHGKLLSCQFQFPDMLNHEQENWGYCKNPDRRFWSEVRSGLKPAKVAQKTEIDPPRRIPPGCYDTNDGFFDPKSLTLLSPAGELLRVPICKEDFWIKKYCRKGFLQPTDFRPDLFENWFDYDEKKIQSILHKQDDYRRGLITFDDLQQFYADLNLLPPWSKFQRRQSPEEIAEREYIKSIPHPKLIKPPKNVEKYEGHKISTKVKSLLHNESDEKKPVQSSWLANKKSKSFIRFDGSSKAKILGSAINARSSRISFKLSDESGIYSERLSSASDSTIPAATVKKKIPERYLKYQPILRPPFMLKSEIKPPEPPEIRKKCVGKKGSNLLKNDWGYLLPEGSTNSLLERKELRRFMKSIVMDAVTQGLILERERHRKRLTWARKVPFKTFKGENANERCLRVLEELFDSIPDKEEYCDSSPSKTCDLKKIAEDKYNVLKYWGKRMFYLEFEDEKRH